MKKLLLFLLMAPFGLTAQNFWTEVAPFAEAEPYYYVRDISIVNEEVIWVHGFTDTFPFTPKWSRSLDGGVTWESGVINLGNLNLGIASLHATSADRAYVNAFPNGEGDIGGVWVTVDAGATWSQQLGQNWTTNESLFPNFVHFWNQTDGIVVCDPSIDNAFQIYTTVDAGVTWTLAPAANIPAPLSGEYGYTRCFDDANGNFWFGTNKGRIYYTNASNLSNGLVWQAFQTPITDFGSANQSAEFTFKNQNEGLLVTSDFNFYRTIDSGATWSQEFPAGIYRNFTITHVTGTSNSYFSTGEDTDESGRGSSYSTNGGYNWIDLDEVDEDPVFPELTRFASGTVGFCIGTYLSDMGGTKHFFRMTDPMNRLLKTNTFEAKGQFTAVPNPTKDVVKLSGANIASVQICDLSGKAIMTQNYSGMKEVTIDMAFFQNGLYLAKITGENGTADTVKLLKK